MKIDSKILSIPPYVSVTWDQIALIQTEMDDAFMILVLHLRDGKEIKIPHLDFSLLEQVFECHRKYLEQKNESRKLENSSKNPASLIQQLIGLPPEQLGGIPIRFGITGIPGIEDMAMQHNSQMAHTPDLPADVIEKIASTAKMVTGGDLSLFPKPEAHCNCMYCQVARAIHGIQEKEEPQEELVTEEDLMFRDWEVEEIGKDLYKVTNPLDVHESYNVYLGTPVGCTCGVAHCEHIRSVLYSS